VNIFKSKDFELFKESFPNLIGERITIASNDTNTLIRKLLEITNNNLSMNTFTSFQNLLFDKITSLITSQNTLQNLNPKIIVHSKIPL
jgi:hypothetical protein